MIKKTITTLGVLSALLILFSSTCQVQYPDLEDGLYAKITTNKGTMVAKLFFEKTPVTVASFVALAEGEHPLADEKYKSKPFYENLTFHRVMDNFMIQGGDPTGTGSGSAGFKFEDEFEPTLKHDKPGILSMANSGPDTNGSQFYITEKPTPWLDAYQADGTLKKCGAFPGGSCHTVFGELVKGLEIQDSISNVKVGAASKPIEDVVITKLTIIRKGSAAKQFKAPKVFTEELPKIKERAAAAKEAAEKEKKALVEASKEAFLKKNADLTGRKIESPTGMVMLFTHESRGITPQSNQRVNINCAGYLENGELFWTTHKDIAQAKGKYDENQDKAGRYVPFDMPYNKTAGLIAGFREAMLNMKIGDKARVFIPSYLGYGESGRPPVIPGGANLVFDVELVSIKK